MDRIQKAIKDLQIELSGINTEMVSLTSSRMDKAAIDKYRDLSSNYNQLQNIVNMLVNLMSYYQVPVENTSNN